MIRWSMLFCLLLAGCSTAHDLGGGRYVVTRASEVRSPFGTNVAWTMLETCDGSRNAYFPWQTDYRNCQGITDWSPLGSQGQGGQIVQGALMGIGLGVLGATMPSSSASAVATQSQSVTRGH